MPAQEVLILAVMQMLGGACIAGIWLFGSLAAMTAKDIGVVIDHLEQDGPLERFERGQFPFPRIAESGLQRLKTHAGCSLATQSPAGLAAQPHWPDSLEE